MLTIIMPAYNEAELIEQSVREWYSGVISRIPGSLLIVVDDHSRDETPRILERLAAELPHLRPVLSPENRGHGQSVLTGLKLSTTEYVFQTDSDRQHVPAEFWNLWNVRDGHDFVFGIRARREDGLFRKFITTCMLLVNMILWGAVIRDANCPFKLMRREPLVRLIAILGPGSFIPMVSISILARKLGYSVREVMVTHLPRRGGTQSLRGMWRWLRISRDCFWELLMLRLTWRSRADAIR